MAQGRQRNYQAKQQREEGKVRGGSRCGAEVVEVAGKEEEGDQTSVRLGFRNRRMLWPRGRDLSLTRKSSPFVIKIQELPTEKEELAARRMKRTWQREGMRPVWVNTKHLLSGIVAFCQRWTKWYNVQVINHEEFARIQDRHQEE